MNRGVKIGIRMLVILIVAVASVFFLTSGMEKTADGFFSAVRNNDIARARTYLSEGVSVERGDTELQIVKLE